MWSAPAAITPSGWTTSYAAAPGARVIRVRRCSSPAGKTTSQRPTWRYNQLTAQQRAIIVERRNTLLSTAAASEELAELAPERYEELSKELSEEQLEKICRLIMLYHLDRGWADHLAYLADIRESIHLRALGRHNPLDEFHRMAVDAFASLAADAIEAAQQTFETSTSIKDEPGVDLSKLARPTSTWTYMVHDNPLSDDSLSALSLPGIFR
jgi:preprotein translocase subunit SecA